MEQSRASSASGFVSQSMYWQGFSKRGPQASQIREWEMWQPEVSVSLSPFCPLIRHLARPLVWPFSVLPKVTSNISVSPSPCALAALGCSYRPGLCSLSPSSHGPQDCRMECCDHTATLSWGDAQPRPTLSNSQGRLQRGFAQTMGEGRKLFLCLFFSPWAFSGKKFCPFAYFKLYTWTI